MKYFILGLLGLLVSGSMANADVPTTHGMLLFGNETVYASHLPMFHSPHDYQLILELDLEGVANFGLPW